MKLLEETGVVSLIFVAEMAAPPFLRQGAGDRSWDRTVTAEILLRCYRLGFS